MTTQRTTSRAGVRVRAPLGRVLGRGLLAALVAVAVTTAAAALARAAGIDFELPDGGEPIPLAGFSVVTGVFAMLGLVVALGLRRWSARPDARFVQVTVVLTALSLVPPFLADADAASTTTLVLLHVLAAAVVIPTIAAGLRVPRT